MPDNPYAVVPSPNYAAPMVNLFGQNQGSQQQGQSTQNQGQQAGQTLASLLQKFLQTGQGGMAPGSSIPGAAGPTSVGGPNGPSPLMASSSAPTMDPTMIGSLY